MDTVNLLGGVAVIAVAGAGFYYVAKNSKTNQASFSAFSSASNTLTADDLITYIKEVYSKHLNWNDSIKAKSAYITAKEEFAKLLLDNIENESKFLEIYNSDYIKKELLNINLDKKYDILEENGDVPLDIKVNFDKFNLNGTLTEKIKKLMIEFYKEGVNEIKNDIKYEVKSKNWDRIKKLLEKEVKTLA